MRSQRKIFSSMIRHNYSNLWESYNNNRYRSYRKWTNSERNYNSRNGDFDFSHDSSSLLESFT